MKTTQSTTTISVAFCKRGGYSSHRGTEIFASVADAARAIVSWEETPGQIALFPDGATDSIDAAVIRERAARGHQWSMQMVAANHPRAIA